MWTERKPDREARHTGVYAARPNHDGYGLFRAKGTDLSPLRESIMHDIVQLRQEGLYCPAGDFSIDPWQPVATAVLTHGYGDHARPGMGCYHTSAPGLSILQW